jgi:hypothetical protein
VLIPESGASKVIYVAISAPATYGVYRAKLSWLDTNNSTVIRIKDSVSSAMKAAVLHTHPALSRRTARHRHRCTSQHQHRERDTNNRAKEVSGGVEEHIPWIHFSQPVKREGYCGIEMTSGLFAPRRHDNRYYGRAQSQSSEQPTESGADNEVSEWRGRVLEQARKCAGKEHVQCQLAGFHQIFRPVEAQAAERTHGLSVDHFALC